jgi:tetratricopeptide (TPR) repeat protein
LLLIALLVGVAVLGLQLWSRSAISTEEPEVAEAEGRKGPITGPLNEAESGDEARAKTKSEAAAMAFDETEIEEPTEAAVAEADPEPEPAAEPAPKPKPQRAAEKRVAEKPAAIEPATRSPAAPAIPTQNLPRDPAKASDVLVHRALPLIRAGDLVLAEATLDRAWELDPKNPQAMAGYARLFIAKKDGPRATKWAKKAVRKRGRRAEYHVLYGDALRLEGDIEAARKSWRKALSVDPENRSAKARLAETRPRVAN